MTIQNLISFCQFSLKTLIKNQILTLIKGHNSVANLPKTTIYNTNVDLVIDDEEQNLVLFCLLVLKTKQILTPIKGRNSVANLQKKQRFTILMLILSMIMCIQNLVSICLFVLKILMKKPNSDVNQGL